ncbi:MAG: hypothetical protein GY814_11210 [Gammaproteobacteria bacterium]|nr:hypothetical protein [Gammaproteobacteria bacterium]
MSKETENSTTEENEAKDNLQASISIKVEVQDDSSDEKKEEERPGVCCGSCT